MLLGHQWRFDDYSRIPVVGKGSTSDSNVYTEKYAGSTTSQAPIWKRVLYFKSVQPTLAGMYICVANYETFFNQSVEIQVASE